MKIKLSIIGISVITLVTLTSHSYAFFGQDPCIEWRSEKTPYTETRIRQVPKTHTIVETRLVNSSLQCPSHKDNFSDFTNGCEFKGAHYINIPKTVTSYVDEEYEEVLYKTVSVCTKRGKKSSGSWSQPRCVGGCSGGGGNR